MTSTPEDFLPTASRWFSPTLEYVGRCRAEFSAPRGSVEGLAKVAVDEARNVSVEMVPEPESLRTERTFRLGLLRFFKGNEFVREHSGGVSTLDMEAENPCTKLEVETPHGTFRTEDILNRFTESVLDTGEVPKITFAVGRSRLEVKDAGDPAYWVLPLTNFLSEFKQRHPELDRHPLRIFPTPDVPSEVTRVPLGGEEEEALKEKAVLSLWAANSKNNLIVFEYAGELGFVEQLPGYAENEQMLLEGKSRLKITAVMVGSTGGKPVETFERIREWLPFDVLCVLTLATGAEVGCPWVEIRNGEGQLVHRFHQYLGTRPFRKGRRLTEEVPMLGDRGMKATGRLISRACAHSKELGQTFLRVAIVHLVRARYEDQTLDDSMSHLARGLETLGKRYRTMGEMLGRGLGTHLRDDVRNILQDAATHVRALKAEGTIGPGQKSSLDRIANKVHSADQRDNSFGGAVIKLLKSFWLPDAHILEAHYQNRKGGWAGILGQYRGDVTHHGYLPILEENRDVEELIVVRGHLHDALVRVILKILAFDSGYKPGFVPEYGVSRPVDWVKPHFSPQDLGYK